MRFVSTASLKMWRIHYYILCTIIIYRETASASRVYIVCVCIMYMDAHRRDTYMYAQVRVDVLLAFFFSLGFYYVTIMQA